MTPCRKAGYRVRIDSDARTAGWRYSPDRRLAWERLQRGWSYGKPASQLGLLTPNELAMRPQAETLHEFRRLWDMLTADDNGGGWERAALLRARWDVHHPFGGLKKSGSAFEEQGIDALRYDTRVMAAAIGHTKAGS